MLLCREVTGTERMGETQVLVTSTGDCSGTEGRYSSGQDETEAAVVEMEWVWAWMTLGMCAQPQAL